MRISARTPVRMHLSLHMWALLINLIAFITACVFFHFAVTACSERIYIFVYTCFVTIVYTRQNTCLHVYTYACLDLHACMSTHQPTHLSTYMCVHACPYNCLYLHVYTCLYTWSRTHRLKRAKMGLLRRDEEKKQKKKVALFFVLRS